MSLATLTMLTMLTMLTIHALAFNWQSFAHAHGDPVYFRKRIFNIRAPIRPDNREACLKQSSRRILPLVFGVVFVLGLLAGCKAGDSAVAQPTATNTAVQITLVNTRHGVSDPVGVMVKNTGSANLYAIDGHAACTILQLQQYSSSKKTWSMSDTCKDKEAPHVLLIRAGMSEPFTLAPTSLSDPNSWESGSYRVALSFSTTSDGKTGAQTAYSQGFTISG